MKPNIFLIDPALGPEDALTAYWHYLLSVVPGLGQAFVDEVCLSSGLAPSTFIGAIDQPVGDRENRPDLLVQCSDYNLFFEHKLDSPLGLRQLHRYVDFAASKGGKLALLAASRIEIDDEVRSSPSFVYPKGTGRPSHFLWQDLHSILAAVDHHHLAREFSEFLEINGLGTFSWGGLGNPFIDQGAANALLALYDSIPPICAGPGVQCRRSASSLIYQVRTPFPPVHLINLGPLPSVAQENPTLRGPVMGLWVWVRRNADPQRRVLPKSDRGVEATSLAIVVRDHDDARSLPYDRQVFGERSYYVPLEYILQDSLEASEERLVKFVRTAVSHLREDVAALRHGA